jgi:alpha-L-rhamnosidase
MFDYSRLIDGITQSRYPSRVTQIIPPFSLWWVCMIWDFGVWRGDKAFVKSLLPGARMVLDWFRAYRGQLGLVESPDGWNYVDWVAGWKSGMPPGADDGVSLILNRQFEIALRKMAELENWVGEPEMAQRNLRTASEISAAIHRSFWNNKRAMYADDLAHSSYSEHGQVLSILTESLPEKIERMVAQGLLTDQELHRTTVYFSHYLFEAFGYLGRTDLILDRMSLWFDHLKTGMKTIMEQPEPTRSDCHAWGAHPLFHYVASFLGVRPKALGATELEIKPNLGGLEFFESSFPFGASSVSVRATAGDVGLELAIVLPEGLTATVIRGDQRVGLRGGAHEFTLP